VAAPSRRSGLALIELIVAIIIIVILAAAFYGLWGRKGKGDKSMPAQVKDKATGVECQSNLRQLRMSIDMEKQVSDQPPATLPSGLESISKCPISGQAYTYDARTGQVGCTTQGHERH